MKNFLLLAIILLWGCSGSPQPNTGADTSPTTDGTEEDGGDYQNMISNMDSILEKNDPRNLDLTRHQLFLDTTRKSLFYESLETSHLGTRDNESIAQILTSIKVNVNHEQFALPDFPNRFITLRKLNGNFVLYDRCDGIDQQYEVCDSAFIIHGPLESDAEWIEQVQIVGNNEIQLTCRPHPLKSSAQYSTISIKMVDDFRYTLAYKSGDLVWSRNVTVPKGIRHFDMVVNHCPTMKIPEYAELE